MVVNCFCIFNSSQPTANSRNSQPHRWRTGGGIEQECVYSVYCGSLLYDKLMNELDIIQADCEASI
jgi:hypothetical protein